MQAYRILPGAQIDGLHLVQEPSRAPGKYEVLVRIHAVSLNYRDLMIAQGNYVAVSPEPVIPVADGAGEVIAVGAAVTRFKVGDRVVNGYFPNWIDGAPTPAKTATSFGADIDGVLAEQVVFAEDALVAIPGHLNYAEAATLSCAGITAWNTLFCEGALKPGHSVLLLGTGGVSIWALQLAKAAGLQVLITSSSDAKLERARALGADVTINYRSTPQWHEEVLRHTGGHGVDMVVEVGGDDTLPRSIAATRMGGDIAIIGGVSGFSAQLNLVPVLVGNLHLNGIFVGSRTMFEDLNHFVARTRIRPVVDRVFAFDHARAAYEYLQRAGHFGKVVIAVVDGADSPI
jgi:NADPH:quinone reductase-like Zn-dependent oxidoreductase